MENEKEAVEEIPAPQQGENEVVLTKEQLDQLKKQQQMADFSLGAQTKHLRLPDGLPK